MVNEDISKLFEDELGKRKAKELAAIFEKERKWAYLVRDGCSFVLNSQFCAGLSALGYELQLVKKQ